MPEFDLLASLILFILLPVLVGLLALLLIWTALLLGWHPQTRVKGSVIQVRNSFAERLSRDGREFRHVGDGLMVRLDSFSAAQFRFINEDGNVTVMCRGREGEAWWWFAVFLLFGFPGTIVVVGAALFVAIRAKRKAASFIRATARQISAA